VLNNHSLPEFCSCPENFSFSSPWENGNIIKVVFSESWMYIYSCWNSSVPAYFRTAKSPRRMVVQFLHLYTGYVAALHVSSSFVDTLKEPESYGQCGIESK